MASKYKKIIQETRKITGKYTHTIINHMGAVNQESKQHNKAIYQGTIKTGIQNDKSHRIIKQKHK